MTATTGPTALLGTTPPARCAAAWTLHEKIDVCRGLFAALVVVAHGVQVAMAVHPGVEQALTPWVRELIASSAGNGTIYVMGFFVVSGYCIHLSVARLDGEGRFPLGTYLVARLTRILPLYYAALLLAVGVEWDIASHRPPTWPHGVSAGVLAAQLALVQNLSQTYGSFAPSWSITNEAFYYVFYGLLAAAFLAPGRESRAAWLGLAVCAAVAAVTQVLYVTVGRNPYVYGTGMLFGLGMLWFLGALVAIYGPGLGGNRGVMTACRAWPLLYVGVIAWKFAHLPPHGLYLISGLAFAMMLLGFHAEARDAEPPPAPTQGPRAWLVETLGLTSYPMYLFHGPLMMLAGSCVMRWGLIGDWRITWAVLVALGLGSGVVLGRFVEAPVMAWRAACLRRLKTRHTASRPARPVGAVAFGRPAVGAGLRP
jgi:peptidoglycan/LPS O-acetylase OafA/YrhL